MEASSSTAKSLVPPTIANRGKHQQLLAQFGAATDDETKLPALDDMPLALQAHAMEHSWRPSTHLETLQQKTEQMERAMMAGSPDEANFLCMLLEMLDAKTVIEIGVFRGLTTLALAECLHGMTTESKDADNSSNAVRKVYGLDISDDYATIGKEAWKAAGVDDHVDFRVGDAKETLRGLIDELGPNTVDLVFIDADKTSYDAYYESALEIVRPGGLLVVDNTLWGGSVAVPTDVLEKAAAATDSPGLAGRATDALAIQRLNAKIGKDKRVARVSFLTIADGVTLCRKK